VSDAAGTDPAAERYRAALAQHGIRDVQPAYRAILRRLKATDIRLYEEAVQRYDAEVRPAVEEGSEDPLLIWIRYGSWLANHVAPGHLIAIDASGRAGRPADAPTLGLLLLHLPDGKGERAVTVAGPVEPSAAQDAAQELLCG
jgi:hypothetical protein